MAMAMRSRDYFGSIRIGFIEISNRLLLCINASVKIFEFSGLARSSNVDLGLISMIAMRIL